MAEVFAKNHSGYLPDGTHFQKLSHFLFCEKTGGAVGAVGKNIKASFVPDVLVSGEPNVALLGDEADQQNDYGCCAQAKRRKDCKQVLEWVPDPDAGDLFSRGVEGGINAQAQRVEKHPVEIPSDEGERNVDWQLGFMAFIPASYFTGETVFQLFNQLG